MESDFYNFLAKQSKKENKEWLEEIKKEYDRSLCNFCHSSDVKTIVNLKFMFKCNKCGEFTEVPYNASLLNGEIEIADKKIYDLIQSKLEIK